jgi:hypothetical protein
VEYAIVPVKNVFFGMEGFIHSNGGVSHTRFGSARLVRSWVSLNSVMYIRTLVVRSFGQR